MLKIICQFFLCIFSFTTSSHFLGGSFTYKHIQQILHSKLILVEIRFHITNQFFLCTSEHINKHTIVYLTREKYDQIKCLSERLNKACDHFKESIWAYCENANEKNGYSILKRQFLLIIERFKPLTLFYGGCCWANSSYKYFYFNLSIETDLTRMNSSPYPYIPASYYVPFNQSNRIEIFIFDADGDEIICEPYQEDLGGYLTVHVNDHCQLNYKIDRLGRQFGQFWLMDRYQNRILSRSLISIQVYVLENILCNNQTKLILPNQSDYTMRKLNESIEISVRLYSNCVLIKPEDQIIIEITTLCTKNNQANVLDNGGIEVLFQCQLNLCEIYHVCFVGEMGLKLPATDIQCLSIEITGSKNECTKAADEYDFNTPRNHHIIITESIDIKPSSATESQSRKWLWVFLAHLTFLLIAIITYCGCKQMLLLFYNRSFRKQFQRKRMRTITESYPNTVRRDRKSIEPLLPKQEHVLSKKEKTRTQYLRLGSVDHHPNNH